MTAAITAKRKNAPEASEMAYDFSGLTNAQQWILTCQGWPCGDLLPKPRRSTYQPLVDRGLATFHPKRVGGTDLGRIEVPLDVHMAWCWSAEALLDSAPAAMSAKRKTAQEV